MIKMGYYSRLQAMGGFHHGDRVRIKPEYRGKTYAARMKRSGEWILTEFKTSNWKLKRPGDYTGLYTQGLLAKPHMLEKVEPKTDPTYEKVFGKKSPTGIKPHQPPLQSMPPKQKIVAENVPTVHVNDPDFVQKFVDAAMTEDSLKDITGELMIEGKKSGVFEWAMTDEQVEQMKMYTDTKPMIKQLPADHWAPKPAQPQGSHAPEDKYPRGAIVIVNDPTGGIPKGKLMMITAGTNGGPGCHAYVTALFTGELYVAKPEWLTIIPEKDLTITYLPQ